MSLSKVAIATALSFSVAFGASSACTETIEVTDMDFRQSVDCDYFSFPCDTLEGTYYFTGYDSSGNPTYTQPSTGAFFSVYVETWNPSLASLAFTYGSAYFAPTWDHFADVEFLDQCTNTDIFEVEYGALTGGTNIQYFPVTGSGTSYPPLYITAILDDCTGIGFDNQVPTPQPTDRPTSGTVTCSNYDDTIYSKCNEDTHCADCQTWGCASCESGYYKMGNLMRCQSCSDNYPGCGSCGDWNGCTSCTVGTLGYSQECNDEICQ